MKKIQAIINTFKLEDTKEALAEGEVTGITVSEVSGYGAQKGHTELYRGAEYAVDFVPKVKMEIFVNDDFLQPTIDIIKKAAFTGKMGDGKIFVENVTEVIRIRTGETGGEAI